MATCAANSGRWSRRSQPSASEAGRPDRRAGAGCAALRAAASRTCAAATPPRARAARTRVDLAQFAAGPARAGCRPREVGPRELRRYVARLSAGGRGAASTARASSRRCGRCSPASASTGRSRSSPADLVSAPRRAHACRACSGAAEAAGAARRASPPASPLRAARPRDVRARLRVRPARRGARVAADRRRRPRRRAAARRGQGSQDALRAGRRARAGGAAADLERVGRRWRALPASRSGRLRPASAPAPSGPCS